MTLLPKVRAVLVLIAAVGSVSLPADAVTPASPTATAGQTFREQPDFPEMTVVPAGKFVVTAKPVGDGQDELPQDLIPTKFRLPPRPAEIKAPFAVGKYPVTRGEFAEFLKSTHRVISRGCYLWGGTKYVADQWIADAKAVWFEPGFKQTDSDPVVCVSFEDAMAYVHWLNAKLAPANAPLNVDGPYRLPTLDEAEYFSGAGAKTLYAWGDKPQREMANYGKDDCFPCGGARVGHDRWFYTSPVGMFPPNAFGLFDTAGNVWQAATDCAKCEGSAYGGAWNVGPNYLQIGQFWGFDPNNRNTTLGFRVVRDLR